MLLYQTASYVPLGAPQELTSAPHQEMRLFQILPYCDCALADWTISSETNIKHYFSHLLLSELKTDCASNVSMNWFNTTNQLVCLEERLKLIPSGVPLFNRFHVKAGTWASVQPPPSPAAHQQSDSSHENLRVFIKTTFILLENKETSNF